MSGESDKNPSSKVEGLTEPLRLEFLLALLFGKKYGSSGKGSSNEELKAYAKATNKLANLLTHKRDAKKQDMLLSVSATMALINFIGILEEKI